MNREHVLWLFDDVRVLNNRQAAEGYALAILDDMNRTGWHVENGVVFIDDFADIPFPKQGQLIVPAGKYLPTGPGNEHLYYTLWPPLPSLCAGISEEPG